MKNAEYKHIQTGADLINTNILQFLVENGHWIGEIVKENDTHYVLCMDTSYNLVRKIKIAPTDTLCWDIKILKKKVTHK
jgi:hypothetical protein